MKVWVYSGQHDLEIDIVVFAETAEKAARDYAQRQKRFFKNRLIYTLDKMEVREK